jgi:membrane protease YdiL (CAAX protease family)
LLVAPVSIFVSLLVLSITSAAFVPGIYSSGQNAIASMFGLPGSNKMMLVLFVLMIGLFNGFVEELGWTGFVTPRLRLDQSLITSGVLLGFFWGLWHLLSNYLGSAAGAGSVPLIFYMPVLLFSFLPPFRIIMAWVYKHTESLFLAILMHANLDVFWILSMPAAITGKVLVTWYILWALVLWGLVFIISLADKKMPSKELTFKMKAAGNPGTNKT